MPAPGSTSAARLEVDMHDIPWDVIYAPLAYSVSFLAERLNALQFLSIRQYLSFVFFALVFLLLVIAIWS